ncbi:MAG: nucleotidyltransferase domain-containing protein [Nanoarchaeota archaeon]|nr:nucleotidyltransferase domain-containing protein [Nanoarchaeota archaeon]
MARIQTRGKANVAKIKKAITPLLRQNDVIRASIFGSYARGQEKKNSDVDILVKFKGRKSLLNLARLELKIEKKLKKRAELLTYSSINPHLKERILNEEVRIL